jgi:hypothetical protein
MLSVVAQDSVQESSPQAVDVAPEDPMCSFVPGF